MDDCQFDLDAWIWKSLQDYLAYGRIHDLVNDPEAVEAHKGPGSADEALMQLRDMLENDLRNALSQIASQSIVSLCTTFEVAAKEFFKSLFCKYPHFMHKYTGSEGMKGTVSLNDIVDVTSYAALIANIAEKASSSATKGKYGEILRRAYDLCKCSCDAQLVHQMNGLQSQRNKIVHEKLIPSLGVNEVSAAHDLMAKAIEEMGRLAVTKGLPGRYSYLAGGEGDDFHIDTEGSDAGKDTSKKKDGNLRASVSKFPLYKEVLVRTGSRHQH